MPLPETHITVGSFGLMVHWLIRRRSCDGLVRSFEGIIATAFVFSTLHSTRFHSGKPPCAARYRPSAEKPRLTYSREPISGTCRKRLRRRVCGSYTAIAGVSDISATARLRRLLLIAIAVSASHVSDAGMNFWVAYCMLYTTTFLPAVHATVFSSMNWQPFFTSCCTPMTKRREIICGLSGAVLPDAMAHVIETTGVQFVSKVHTKKRTFPHLVGWVRGAKDAGQRRRQSVGPQ
mmetsp:Transcript_38183/g.117965  ORF Transcript_38183/g.117965 Transcript_38183/m.117965 type:complete len:234 (-) Transcript_38183:21-722(-)